ncbi:unnamed protein product [Gordionus sp. m RMFG-2023]
MFIVDTSFSMNQKTFAGTTYLDIAKTTIELFLKLRAKDISSRGDRYMLLTTEEYPYNIKAGWRENHSTFNQELKNLKAYTLPNISLALKQAFDLLNINRLMSGIDTYGQGRCLFYLEYSIIIFISDGAFIKTNTSLLEKLNTLNNKSTILGNELISHPFRWDQKFYSIILSIPGIISINNLNNEELNEKYKSLNKLCEMTGANNYLLHHPTCLNPYLEWLLQKLQPPKVTSTFNIISNDNHVNEKIGNNLFFMVPPPAPPFSILMTNNDSQFPLEDVDMRIKDTIFVNVSNDKNLNVQTENHQNQENRANLITNLYVNPKSINSNNIWPIPESFYPNYIIDHNCLPVRSSIPNLRVNTSIPFSEDSQITKKCQNFPTDYYEIEMGPLTQYIASYFNENGFKDPPDNTFNCFRVELLIKNNKSDEQDIIPFGYIKFCPIQPPSNGVNRTSYVCYLCISTFNYPVLIDLIDEMVNVNKFKPNPNWRNKFDTYISQIPAYYISPLKKAFQKMGLQQFTVILENMNESSGLSYDVITYLKKIKNQAKIEYDQIIASISNKRPFPFKADPLCPIQFTLKLPVKPIMTSTDEENSFLKKFLSRPIFDAQTQPVNDKNKEDNLEAVNNIFVLNLTDRNRNKDPIIRKCNLLSTLKTLRNSLLNDPWCKLNLPNVHRSLQHSYPLTKYNFEKNQLPINQMGNYQDYLKKNEIPLRQLDNTNTVVRQHLFGNPFKVDKRSMMVDETDNEMWTTTTTSNTMVNTSLLPSPLNSPLQPLHLNKTLKTSKRFRTWSGPIPSDYKYVPSHLRGNNCSNMNLDFDLKPADSESDDNVITDIDSEMTDDKNANTLSITSSPPHGVQEPTYQEAQLEINIDMNEDQLEPFDNQLRIDIQHESSNSTWSEDKKLFVKILLHSTRDVIPHEYLIKKIHRHMKTDNFYQHVNSDIFENIVDRENLEFYLNGMEMRDIFDKASLKRFRKLKYLCRKLIRNDVHDAEIFANHNSLKYYPLLHAYLLRDIILNAKRYNRHRLASKALKILKDKLPKIISPLFKL